MQASSSNGGSVQKQMFWDAAALDGAKRAGAKITNFQAQDYNPLNPSQIMVSTSPSLLRQVQNKYSQKFGERLTLAVA